jgi:hypothetical protein
MVGDFGVEKSGVKSGQQTIHLSDGNAQAGGVEIPGVFVIGDFGGEVKPETHFLDPGLVVEPFLVAAVAPAGKVIGADFVASFRELFGNQGIGCAITEQVIEEVPDVTGQAGNFTGAASVQMAGRAVKWRNYIRGNWGLRLMTGIAEFGAGPWGF